MDFFSVIDIGMRELGIIGAVLGLWYFSVFMKSWEDMDSIYRSHVHFALVVGE